MKSTTSWTLHWDTCFDEREPEILGDPKGSGLGGSGGRFFTTGVALGHSLLLGGQSLEREGTLRDDPQDDLRNNPPDGYLL